MSINQIIAHELAVKIHQIDAAVALLDEGSTVPFISRYRKEVTGGLDDTQLRLLEERLGYLRELAARRTVILDSIAAQEKLTPDLEAAILAAQTKTWLEDLYLPFKPKRRTKAQIAREAGLEPLMQAILDNRQAVPETLAKNYVNAEKGIENVAEALEGARQILMETLSENAPLLADCRQQIWAQGVIHEIGRASCRERVSTIV